MQDINLHLTNKYQIFEATWVNDLIIEGFSRV